MRFSRKVVHVRLPGHKLASSGSSGTCSLNTALKENAGLTRADLENVPHKWRSCHGNSYPLYQRSDIARAVNQKKATDPEFAASLQKADDKRTVAAAKQSLKDAEAALEAVRAKTERGGYLPALGGARVAKTIAKRAYCLDDGDLRGLSVEYGRGMMGNSSENYLPAELQPVAEAKHGGAAGFLARRQKREKRANGKEVGEQEARIIRAKATLERLGEAVPGAAPAGTAAAAAAKPAAGTKRKATELDGEKVAALANWCSMESQSLNSLSVNELKAIIRAENEKNRGEGGPSISMALSGKKDMLVSRLLAYRG